MNTVVVETDMAQCFMRVVCCMNVTFCVIYHSCPASK